MDVRKSGLLNRSLPLLLPIAWVALYWSTFSGLLGRWLKWDEAVAHGLPVLLIFLYLLFKRLPEVVLCRPRPAERWLALGGVTALSLFWAIVDTIHIDILAQLVLLPIFVLAHAALYGLAAAWRLAPLWPFFLLAIPVWDYLNNPLLYLSSEVVGSMVRLVGMPALIQGNSIFIPQGHILIADGCSGLRYLIIALALGYLVALLNRYSLGKSLITLTTAALLGLVTNWIRIFILIVVGYQTEMQSSLMSDHEYFGWVLFALICFPALYLAPVIKHKNDAPDLSGRAIPSLSAWCLVAVTLLTGPALALVSGGVSEESRVNLHLGRVGIQVEPERMPLMVTAPAANTVEAVALPEQSLYIRVDHYQRRDREQKLVPYIKRLYNSELWLIEQSTVGRVNSRPVSRRVFRQKAGGQRVAQVQWFETGGHQSASVFAAKLWQIPASLAGGNRFTITTLQARCAEQQCEERLAQLESMAKAVMAENRSG